MRRRTIELPDDLDAWMRHEAGGRGVSVSELVRTAIEAYLEGPRKLRAAGAGASGQGDISEWIKEILGTTSTHGLER